MQVDPGVTYEKLLSTAAGLAMGTGLSVPALWSGQLLVNSLQLLADNSLPGWDVPTWLGVLLFVGTVSVACIGFTWWLASIHGLLNAVSKTVKALQHDSAIRYRRLRRRARKNSDIVRILRTELTELQHTVAGLQQGNKATPRGQDPPDKQKGHPPA